MDGRTSTAIGGLQTKTCVIHMSDTAGVARQLRNRCRLHRNHMTFDPASSTLGVLERPPQSPCVLQCLAKHRQSRISPPPAGMSERRTRRGTGSQARTPPSGIHCRRSSSWAGARTRRSQIIPPRKRIAETEDAIGEASAQKTSKSTLAEHRRRDGPHVVGFPWWEKW